MGAEKQGWSNHAIRETDTGRALGKETRTALVPSPRNQAQYGYGASPHSERGRRQGQLGTGKAEGSYVTRLW